MKKRVIDEILGLKLRDNVKARELQADGSYRRVKPKRGQQRVDSQTLFLKQSLEDNAPEPEHGIASDLLLHAPARGGENGAGKALTLTELYPLRTEPPAVREADTPPPPDPEAATAPQPADPTPEAAASDASGL